MFGGDRVRGTDYFVAYFPVDSAGVECPMLKVMEADTIDNTITSSSVDDWLLTDFDITGYPGWSDIKYIPMSDSLLFAVHAKDDTMFTNILAIDPSNGSIYESVLYSDTLETSDYGVPSIEYIRDGFFIVTTRGTNAGMFLYEVD